MKTIQMLSQRLGALLVQNDLMMVTAESCTGGGIATAMTDISGSSAWFDRGYITYSNEAKQRLLGVDPETLEKWGAVSELVVEQMAFGALNMACSEVAVAVSGVAGPTGGSEEKPVGTVCFAWADTQGWHQIETHHFDGDRSQVREAVVAHALAVMIEHYQNSKV